MMEVVVVVVVAVVVAESYIFKQLLLWMLVEFKVREVVLVVKGVVGVKGDGDSCCCGGCGSCIWMVSVSYFSVKFLHCYCCLSLLKLMFNKNHTYNFAVVIFFSGSLEVNLFNVVPKKNLWDIFCQRIECIFYPNFWSIVNVKDN